MHDKATVDKYRVLTATRSRLSEDDHAFTKWFEAHEAWEAERCAKILTLADSWMTDHRGYGLTVSERALAQALATAFYHASSPGPAPAYPPPASVNPAGQ